MFGSKKNIVGVPPVPNPAGINPASVPVHTMQDDLNGLNGIKISPNIPSAPNPSTEAPRTTAPQNPIRREGGGAQPLGIQGQTAGSTSPFLESFAPSSIPENKAVPPVSKPNIPPKSSGGGIGKTVEIGAIILFIIILLGGGGYYFYMTRWNTPSGPVVINPEPVVEPEPEVEPLKPEKFSAEKPNYLQMDVEEMSTEDIQGMIKLTTKEVKEDGKAVPIEFVVVDMNNNPIAFKIFAKLSGITLSANLIAGIKDDFSLFLYPDRELVRMGLQLSPIDEAKIMTLMKTEEKTLKNGLAPLFLGEATSTTGLFGDSQYQETDIRYLNLNPENNLSIDYFMRSGNLFITTSKNTGRAIIDKIPKMAPEKANDSASVSDAAPKEIVDPSSATETIPSNSAAPQINRQ